MLAECFLGSSREERRLAIFQAFSGGADVTAPTLLSATIDEAGTTLTLVFSEAVTGVLLADYALSTGTLSDMAGSGTTRTFTITPAIQSGAVITLDYNGTSTEDAAGNDLAAIVDGAVTNNSTQTSYLVDEGFEGAGAPAGWTAGGTPDFDYAGLVLVGAQSLRLAVASSSAYKTFAAGAIRHAYFQLHPTTITGGDVTLGFADAAVSVFTAALRITSGGDAKAVSLASESANSATSVVIDVTRHVWITASNGGTVEVASSTTGTKPTVDGSGNIFRTVAGGASDTGAIFFHNVDGAYVIDRVLVSSNTPFGDNP